MHSRESDLQGGISIYPNFGDLPKLASLTFALLFRPESRSAKAAMKSHSRAK